MNLSIALNKLNKIAKANNQLYQDKLDAYSRKKRKQNIFIMSLIVTIIILSLFRKFISSYSILKIIEQENKNNMYFIFKYSVIYKKLWSRNFIYNCISTQPNKMNETSKENLCNYLNNIGLFFTKENQNIRSVQSIFLLGQSGTGKSFIHTYIARLLFLSRHVLYTPSFTTRGYVGQPLEDAIANIKEGIIILEEAGKYMDPTRLLSSTETQPYEVANTHTGNKVENYNSTNCILSESFQSNIEFYYEHLKSKLDEQDYKIELKRILTINFDLYKEIIRFHSPNDRQKSPAELFNRCAMVVFQMPDKNCFIKMFATGIPQIDLYILQKHDSNIFCVFSNKTIEKICQDSSYDVEKPETVITNRGFREIENKIRDALNEALLSRNKTKEYQSHNETKKYQYLLIDDNIQVKELVLEDLIKPQEVEEYKIYPLTCFNIINSFFTTKDMKEYFEINFQIKLKGILHIENPDATTNDKFKELLGISLHKAYLFILNSFFTNSIFSKNRLFFFNLINLFSPMNETSENCLRLMEEISHLYIKHIFTMSMLIINSTTDTNKRKQEMTKFLKKLKVYPEYEQDDLLS